MHFLKGTTGSELGLTEAGGFVMMETQLEPSSQVPMHTHKNATIVLILSGQYRETFRGSSAPHPPMTIIAKPSGEKHSNEIGQDGAHCLVIELTDEKIREMNGHVQACHSPLAQRHGPASAIGLRIVQELREPDSLTPLALEGAALQLLVELSRNPPEIYGVEPSWMKMVVDLLQTSAPGEISLSTLASTVGVHPVHLARTFRRTHGCSIGQYARKMQLDLVMRMLTRTDEPLSDVAIAAGFYDQSHMSRIVKRASGMNASQIRAAARG